MMDEQQQGIATGFGARMKIARESLHLSEKDAAARLHLNPKIIHLLEDEDFKNAPPATFMRGYFRSYARLLNFGEQDIDKALIQSGLEVKNNTPIKPMPNMGEIYNNTSHVRWITYLVVSVLVVLVGIWWNSHSRYSVSDVLTKTIVRQNTTHSVETSAPISRPAANTVTATPAAPPTAAQPATNTIMSSAPAATPVVIPNALLPSTPIPVTPLTAEQSKTLATTAPENKPSIQNKTEHRMIMALPEPGLESGD